METARSAPISWLAPMGGVRLFAPRRGLMIDDLGAPIDVLWMRLPRRSTDPGQALGYVEGGHVLVTFDRGDYWQCAFVIPKDGYDDVQRRGIAAFRAEIGYRAVHARPDGGAARLERHQAADGQDRSVAQWPRPGLLCIGDAAHAMSPIGGVGINLAIQDAVAAADVLGKTLLDKTPSEHELQAIKDRRQLSHPRHAVRADRHPERSHPACAAGWKAADFALAGASAARVARVAALARPCGWRRFSSGACEDACYTGSVTDGRHPG